MPSSRSSRSPPSADSSASEEKSLNLLFEVLLSRDFCSALASTVRCAPTRLQSLMSLRSANFASTALGASGSETCLLGNGSRPNQQ